METGTFTKTGSGVTPQDGIRPDFESAPDGPLGYAPDIWQLISETATTMTVDGASSGARAKSVLPSATPKAAFRSANTKNSPVTRGSAV